MALLIVLVRQVRVDRFPVDFGRLHFLPDLQLKVELTQFQFKDFATVNALKLFMGGVISGAGRAKYCMNYQSGGRQVGEGEGALLRLTSHNT